MRKAICDRFILLLVVTVATLILVPAAATAQSRDEAHPTTVSTFPISGNLYAGTYYYEARVSSGSATMVLEFTAPNGGGSMSAMVSGPNCCGGAAYVGADTGAAERIRRASDIFPINIPQKVKITVIVAVAEGQSVPFSLNLAVGDNVSGVIVTRPTPTPTPAITITDPNCVDLALENVVIRKVDRTPQLEISGVVRNVSPNAYSGNARTQWVEVLDITLSEKLPRRVAFFRFTNIAPGARFAFRAVHAFPRLELRKYKVRIVYYSGNRTNRLLTDDDCNSSNDSVTKIYEIFEAVP